MSKLMDYQKPELQEYSRFGIIAEGNSPQAPGDERTDVAACNVAGLDEQ